MTISKYYGMGLQSLVEARVNYMTANVRAMLTTSAYTPLDTHQFKSSVTGEVVGAGYTARGVLLTGKAVTWDGTAGKLRLSAANPTWTGTFTVRRLVFYVDTGSDATSSLLSYVDFEADQVVDNAAFTYVIPTSGIAEFAR